MVAEVADGHQVIQGKWLLLLIHLHIIQDPVKALHVVLHIALHSWTLVKLVLHWCLMLLHRMFKINYQTWDYSNTAYSYTDKMAK